MADPDSPVTVPEIDPPATCAFAAGPKNKKRPNVAKMTFMTTPLGQGLVIDQRILNVMLIDKLNSDHTPSFVVDRILST
jgi:hypothetical protein